LWLCFGTAGCCRSGEFDKRYDPPFRHRQAGKRSGLAPRCKVSRRRARPLGACPSTFALSYDAKSVTDARSEFALRTDKSWALQDSIFNLRGRAAWAHDFDPDRSIAATFQTLPGASFVVNGAAQSADKALT
jgi:hypothetical protein